MLVKSLLQNTTSRFPIKSRMCFITCASRLRRLGKFMMVLETLGIIFTNCTQPTVLVWLEYSWNWPSSARHKQIELRARRFFIRPPARAEAPHPPISPRLNWESWQVWLSTNIASIVLLTWSESSRMYGDMHQRWLYDGDNQPAGDWPTSVRIHWRHVVVIRTDLTFMSKKRRHERRLTFKKEMSVADTRFTCNSEYPQWLTLSDETSRVGI